MRDDRRLTAHEHLRRYYLDAMGIQCWQSLDAASQQASAIDVDWQKLDSQVAQCENCGLHTTRKQAITGRGAHSAELMILLLAPDEHDAAAGVLCDGASGELLAKMFSAIDVSLDTVYLTTLLKCSVPAMHTVTTSELHHCKQFLQRQLALVKPTLLMVLGETAARCLLQKESALDDLRSAINPQTLSQAMPSSTPSAISEAGVEYTGKAGNADAMNRFESIPLLVSYSPQELLAHPENKRKAWHDLQQLQQLIAGNAEREQ